MAIEDEFGEFSSFELLPYGSDNERNHSICISAGFEIPDGHAEKLLRPADIVQYVGDKKDVYE